MYQHMEVSSSERSRLPQFIVGGGMKCGTTSLRWILRRHERIFIAPRSELEPHFFTIDDIEQNPDFFLKSRNGWTCWDFDKNFRQYLNWYLGFFEGAQEGQLIGEHCVSYLSSKKAAARISSILPDVKLVFVLRDPVDRTYSQYWHWVRTNRAIYNFENTLQFSPGHLIQRSLYRQHVEEFLKRFDRKQIQFIVFESFIDNVQHTVNEICGFLGLDRSIDVSKYETHINKAVVPRNIAMQLLLNNLVRTRLSGRKYQHYHLPNATSSSCSRYPPTILRVFQKLNLTRTKPYPPMKSDTREFLEAFLAKENRGLSELIEVPVEEFWPYMK
jgi:hypothetical protein